MVGLVALRPRVELYHFLHLFVHKTATQILQNLASERERKTVIFISHQLSAAAKADRILVMDEGKIVQNGTHEQLVQKMITEK